MKLNKEICIKCHKETIKGDKYWNWIVDDEQRWNRDKVVICAVADAYKKGCPYELEHLVSGTEEIFKI